jgi:oligopeptide/dipeptide ABC transporter ATP-binding protein
MYLGRIVETAGAEDLFERPCHPYTESLISAIPGTAASRGKPRIVLKGDPPSPEHPPPGCHFHPRCPKAFDRCYAEIPLQRAIEGADGPRTVACHLF